MTHLIQLLDRAQHVIATAQMTSEGDLFTGTIDLRQTPPNELSLFEEFEEIVNGQMFAFLDEIQQKIAALAITVQYADGSQAAVTDLQVFPSAGEVSFRLDPSFPRNGHSERTSLRSPLVNPGAEPIKKLVG